MSVVSNFDFLSVDLDTAELYATINMAEENYAQKDYEGTLTKVRKVAENTAKLFADRAYIELGERDTFNEILRKIKYSINDKHVVDYFYEIKGKGNNSAHVLNPSDATQENALRALEHMFYILVWFVINYVDDEIQANLFDEFLEPKAQALYKTAERKFIYVQTVDNASGQFPAFDGTYKVGEGTVPEDEVEGDWSPNSSFLRKLAPKRIKQYMKTSGLPFMLGWVELAYRKSDKTWFHDYDVHNVLRRSGIKHAELLEGNEWFDTDLETAKSAIQAVKDGREYINESVEEKTAVVLRPEQEEAVAKTRQAFKTKNTMLWNAKMRFGKTLTALQLVKEEGFQKVLIMTHRPVVSDSWFQDFKKMMMNQEGYEYGSVTQGASLESLKKGNKPFVYFASIQLLRHNNAQTNLSQFAEVDWDLILIDEAHEGTQTQLSELVMEQLVKDKTKVLELSGTPFNLLDKFEEDQVYTWDYTMEQTAKLKWALEKPNEPNPYEKLPKVSMYTFEMKNKKFLDERKSFNFREFFRTDDSGCLVHKQEVRAFLDNITNPDSRTNYPFSTKAYREELRHTLWLLPGVKEANALEDLMKQHPIFGKEYQIVNVVRGSERDSDDGVANEADLEKVRKAITDDPSQTKTITLTVRKLTTGVNIPEWTAVIFLSNTNSAMNYLQAAFRAQTPFAHEKLGMKKHCYIFDFAPDRALTVMAESAQINSGVGKKNTHQQKKAMSHLLNFLPILGQADNGMKTYDVDRMLTQLKKVYAEKAVRSGFEDDSLYNDKLLTLTEGDAKLFQDLNAIVGKTSKQKTPKTITVNDNGLTDEEYEKGEKSKKKKKRDRTPEEQEAIDKIKKAKQQRKTMISILRGVSTKIPLMIYGMDVDIQEDISIEEFVKQVDDKSWKEFMPKGFTKELFHDIAQFYDAEVFVEAGRIIRHRAKELDELDFIERAERIAELFGSFKNPDKETVLTPWRVVNMQIAKGIGGLNFYDDDFHAMTDGGRPNLHWVEREVTKEIYHPETKIIDINSKTGLYPLHAAMSLYYQAMLANEDKRFIDRQVYQSILMKNIYVIAQTPMAKTITERTLAGYRAYKTNVVYIPGLTDVLKQDIDKGKEKVEEAFGHVKFDVVVGNPPYQETDGGANASASPTYQYFVGLSKSLNPNYISLIMPSRWYSGGKGLDRFRDEMLNDFNIRELYDFQNPEDVFPNTNIRGGVCVVNWDKNWDSKRDLTRVVTYENGEINEDIYRPMRYGDSEIFIRDYTSIKILEKVNMLTPLSEGRISEFVSPLRPHGFRGFFTKDKRFHAEASGLDNPILCYGKGVLGYVERSDVQIKTEWIDRWKVFTARANNIGTELNDDNFNTIIGKPGSICTETYLVIGADLSLNELSANNLSRYLRTKFARLLHGVAKSSHDATRNTYKFIPLQDFRENTDIDWSQSLADIDEQLYKKYRLDEKEIAFIEDKIKDMN
ncbi:Eco57I restriction endonuclease [Abiotrophia defectiva ATCC 49176]|uniref:Eco57I restriction endonuclease n=1 Tax=Abiotrophia defectiva ATCC 49176 TaxID=592010 RepID=W1Q1L3_ABIDE|nr:Eco57I restriction endonuclease [Abiotrophia defectiva ATCC 49176]